MSRGQILRVAAEIRDAKGHVVGFTGNITEAQKSNFMGGRLDHDIGKKWRFMGGDRYFKLGTNATADSAERERGVFPLSLVEHACSSRHSLMTSMTGESRAKEQKEVGANFNGSPGSFGIIHGFR